MRLSTLSSITQEPANLTRITEDAIHHVTAQTIDLLHIRELVRAIAENLSRLEATMEEQVDESLLLLFREHTQEENPAFMLLCPIFCLLFFRRANGPYLYLL